MIQRLVRAVLCGVLGAAATGQRFLEVGPTRQFTELQAAVDAAVAGDRILVDAGTYAFTRVSVGARVTCQAGVTVRGMLFENVPAGETASVSGAYVSHAGILFTDQAILRGGASCPPGLPGPPVNGPAPTTTAMPALTVVGRTQPGGMLRFNAYGAPGTYVYWALNGEAADQSFPGVRGPLVPRIDVALFVLGPMVVGAGRTVPLDVPVPNDPALRGFTLFAQTAGIDPAAFPLAFFSAAVQGTVGF